MISHLISKPGSKRAKTYAFCGGAYGDEGKGRIVDMVVHKLSQDGPVVVYRDNGGANAGHTVEFSTGERISFHQLPSGIFIAGATVVLGKEMVLHPGDFLAELDQVAAVTVTADRAKIIIDELIILSLDTHRAYENVLKEWQSGGKGSTGRGISPAYSDVLLRHPLRLRDLLVTDAEKLTQHYKMYAALIAGLGHDLAQTKVFTLSGEMIAVGTQTEFCERVLKQAAKLAQYTQNLHPWLAQQWADESVGFVFEKAQAVGLDIRWGVYPDVTASDTTFDGIFSATEGVVDPDLIQVKAGVIKATYMSSVGVRRLPSKMEESLAHRIREDAHEYGSTTKRPRDIAYLDIPALRYFARVGRVTSLVLTHMDVSYTDQPVKICVNYTLQDTNVDYRPDQIYLDQVSPVYKELESWDAKEVRTAKTFRELPKSAQNFLEFVSEKIGLPIIMITTGPKRDQAIVFEE